MCSECDEIDGTISRYQRLKGQLSDPQFVVATDRITAELEARKAALYPVITVGIRNHDVPSNIA